MREPVAAEGSLAAQINALDPLRQRMVRALMDRREAAAFDQLWLAQARPAQLPPPGDWRLWLICAGRGFGKTRSGAEWVDAVARANPGARIALVGATIDDVRQVMVEGESGIMHLPRGAAGGGAPPLYKPALKRIIWPGGALATCYSAAEPESLRGPQHGFAWCDEVARWDSGAASGATSTGTRRAESAWNNLLLGLRLGPRPRVLATTTPRGVPLVRRLLAEPGVHITRGATQENRANLSGTFIDEMEALYGGTMLWRQELGGELIDDVAGALWTRAMVEAARVAADSIDPATLRRIVVGVDPAAGSSAHDGGDECGIIVAGLTGEGVVAVLDDASVPGRDPARWAAAVAHAAARWGADLVVAEANNGGAMVEAVLRAADAGLPVRLVHATRGKVARAEPVALRYAQGRVVHAGAFPALEDQLCGLIAGGDYAGPGRSPDRADAAVWAINALLQTVRGDGPGVRWLG